MSLLFFEQSFELKFNFVFPKTLEMISRHLEIVLGKSPKLGQQPKLAQPIFGWAIYGWAKFWLGHLWLGQILAGPFMAGPIFSTLWLGHILAGPILLDRYYGWAILAGLMAGSSISINRILQDLLLSLTKS